MPRKHPQVLGVALNCSESRPRGPTPQCAYNPDQDSTRQSGSTAMLRRCASRAVGQQRYRFKILEHVALDRINDARVADTDRIAFRRRACDAAQDLKMPNPKDDPKSPEWRPYIFARDQWHCRICGDRFQYSEAVRKHVAHAHHENMPPSMYEYFRGAVWQRKKIP